MYTCVWVFYFVNGNVFHLISYLISFVYVFYVCWYFIFGGGGGGVSDGGGDNWGVGGCVAWLYTPIHKYDTPTCCSNGAASYMHTHIYIIHLPAAATAPPHT